MRIVIIGAGKLGYSIAELLSKEQYDIVVVDQNEARLETVKDTLDVLTIAANGSSPITMTHQRLYHNMAPDELRLPRFHPRRIFSPPTSQDILKCGCNHRFILRMGKIRTHSTAILLWRQFGIRGHIRQNNIITHAENSLRILEKSISLLQRHLKNADIRYAQGKQQPFLVMGKITEHPLFRRRPAHQINPALGKYPGLVMIQPP